MSLLFYFQNNKITLFYCITIVINFITLNFALCYFQFAPNYYSVIHNSHDSSSNHKIWIENFFNSYIVNTRRVKKNFFLEKKKAMYVFE